ncbi:MAG TPA: YggW family oxidoreductase, partial [bacterium]|nr:YggW family oxidoreductase [bacterium]
MASVYIHIPFCLKKCGYCDFFSVPVGGEGAPHAAYLEAVLRQLERDSRLL